MSANNMRYSLAQVTKRSFAAQTAIRPVESAQAPEVSCTVLPNKLMVNALDLSGALSRITIAFNVGSRNETTKNFGITHVIRSLLGIGTQKCSGFAVVRNIQYNGVHFTCTGDREVTAFNLVGTRYNINCALKYFSAAATAPAYKHWEVNDNMGCAVYQIGNLSPQTRVVDMLHSVAFRTGLGNSLFLKKDYVGVHSPSMLHQFYTDNFTASRAVIAGYNMAFKDVLDFAKSLELPEGAINQGSSKYYGGEIRKHKNSYFAHVAVAAEGVGLKDVKEALTYCVLKYALGAPPSISWGGSQSPLYKAVHEVAPEAGATCFSVNYSDTGLFGFMVSSFAEKAGKAVEEAMRVLKSGCVSEENVKKAKAILKGEILTACENSENLVEDMAIQSLFGGVLIPGPVLAEAVDKISPADVSKVAQKVANGKLSLAAFGDLTHVPYLDQFA